MTRQEVEQAYTANEHGIIRQPGKFEGEMIYAPYFYDCIMESFQDDEVNGTCYFVITDEDRKTFPEIGTSYGLSIDEDSNGFVYIEEYDTKEDYENAIDAQRETESLHDSDEMGA